MKQIVTGTRLLTIREKNRLEKFNELSYVNKMKLKQDNITKYLNCIYLKEQNYENKVVISHQQYRKSTSLYNRKLVNSIYPAFFITIDYIDSIASSPERVIKLFEGIKYSITKDNDYKLIHYIEMGADNSCHSHLFLSSLKSKHKSKQIKSLQSKFDDFIKINKFGIANGSDDNPSVLIELFDDGILNIPKSRRSHYVNKTSNRNYLSLDLENSYIPKCLQKESFQ
jgi:hypothetical protein